MKIIKFFSFAALLSLAWVACKNAGTATTTDGQSVISADSLAVMKAALVERLNVLSNMLTDKIAEVDQAVSLQADEASATTLETLKLKLSETQDLIGRANDVTAENWDAFSTEYRSIVDAAKLAIAGEAATGQLSPVSATTDRK